MAMQSATSENELKKLVRKMDAKVKFYDEGTCKTIDSTMFASVIANMLDPVTQPKFGKECIVDNHKDTKQHVFDFANEGHDHGGGCHNACQQSGRKGRN